MLGRLIRKFVIALSITLAALLWLQWAWPGNRAFIVSYCRNGTYRELRIDDSDATLMSVPRWPVEQALLAGWRVPPKRTNPLPQITVHRLLDGDAFSLQSTSAKRWPIQRALGTLFIIGESQKHLRALTDGGGMITLANGSITPPLSTTAPSPTSISGGVITFSPTTSPGVAITITSPSKFSSTAPATIVGSGNTSTLTFSSLTIIPSYPYRRYGLPLWLVMLIVLIPAWIAGLTTIIRVRRRESRIRRGLCVACGYDLRGRPDAACPECGTPPVGAVA